jgi:hypothetical protein
MLDVPRSSATPPPQHHSIVNHGTFNEADLDDNEESRFA